MGNKTIFFFLILIIILAFTLRFYELKSPLADWHSWRQADTAAVGRHFVNYGIDLLHPKYDDLSSIPSGKENPEGYRMVELPILGGLQALTYKVFPIINFEATCRLISIVFSLLTIIFLFLLIKEISGSLLALLSAFVYAVLPYNIYYGRAILPEPMMITSSLGVIYFFIKLMQNAKIKNQNDNVKCKITLFYLTSLLLLIVSLLLKPFSLFLIVPPVLYIFFKEWLVDKKLNWLIAFSGYWLIGIIPFLLWRQWISQFPEGIPANMWLLNGDGIRFKGAWFYWLFAERISKLILGYWGVFFLGLGILSGSGESGKSGKYGKFYLFWLVGALAYLAVVATGNVRHDYYQILIIPVICVFVAKGILFLLTEGKKIFSHAICYLLFAICFLFMEAFGWYQIRDFFNINHPEIVEAGRALEKISQSEDKVIAPYNGDTAFLYQTNRKGWPIEGNIKDKIQRGAKYYMSVKFDDETRHLMDRCKIEQQEKDFVIISLFNCNLFMAQ